MFVPGRGEPEVGPATLAAELAARTPMRIVEVLAPTRIEPDHVYLLAPGALLDVKDWTLCPSPGVAPGPDQPDPQPPIDGFFGALARDIGRDRRDLAQRKQRPDLGLLREGRNEVREHHVHRINLTLYRLETILNGDLDEFIEELITQDQAERLQSMGEE